MSPALGEDMRGLSQEVPQTLDCCCFLHSQHTGYGIHSDLEQVQGPESHVTNPESLRGSAGEGPHFLPVAEIKTQGSCEEHFSLKYSSGLGSRSSSGYFPLEYPISLMLCVMCQTLML